MRAKLAILSSVLWVSAACAGEVAFDGVAHRIVRGEATNAIGTYVERVFGERYSILKTKKLSNRDVEALREHLKSVASKEPSDNFCGHDPGFAVAIFRKDKVVYDASYCFMCLTVGKATPQGWVRLAMAGTEDQREGFKSFLLDWFNE